TGSNTPASVIVSANPSGLANGTYNGTVFLSANGLTQNVPVSLIVGTGAVSLTFSPASLAFNYQVGGTAPGAQNITVSSSTGTSLSYTAAAATSSGGAWLQVTPATGSTTGTLQASIITAALTTAGTFSGTITVTPTGGTAQTIPVTVTVTAPPTVSA